MLNDAQLKAEWIAELDEMRGRIKAMRQKFVELLAKHGAKQNFDFIIQQNGMFSFSGLSPEQVDRLKKNLPFMLFVLVVSMLPVLPNKISITYVKAL